MGRAFYKRETMLHNNVEQQYEHEQHLQPLGLVSTRSSWVFYKTAMHVAAVQDCLSQSPFYVLKSIQPCMSDDLNSQMLAVAK